MPKDRDDQDRILADRLLNYADAIVAVSFVGVSGLGIAMTDPEARASVARGADWIVGANIIVGFALSVLLYYLRRWEMDLRAHAPLSEKSRVYSGRLHVARFVVIWFAVVQSVLLMWAIR